MCHQRRRGKLSQHGRLGRRERVATVTRPATRWCWASETPARREPATEPAFPRGPVPCDLGPAGDREHGLLLGGEVVREALKRYFMLREYRALRAELTIEAESRGIVTDEDVFDRVS